MGVGEVRSNWEGKGAARVQSDTEAEKCVPHRLIGRIGGEP